MNPYAIEVTQHNGKWRVITSVYGQDRDRFTFKTEKRAVRKVQELERNGYTLVRLPKEQGNAN